MLRIELRDKQIFVTETVLGIFRQFRQLETRQKERGGVVLGQVTENESCVLVCRASVPGEQDRNSITSFRRDRKKAQQIIEYEFHNSARKNTYLGEWHTHPTNKAIPSSRDIQMIAEQWANNEMQVGFILSFIISQQEVYIGLYDGHRMSSIVIGDIFAAT